MSAASAKRPASSGSKVKAAHAGRSAAKRVAPAAARPRSRQADLPVAPELFDGPGYHFAGFRMMCRHRHIRH